MNEVLDRTAREVVAWVEAEVELGRLAGLDDDAIAAGIRERITEAA